MRGGGVAHAKACNQDVDSPVPGDSFLLNRNNEWCEVVEVVVKRRITPPWDQRARGHFTFRVSSTNLRRG